MTASLFSVRASLPSIKLSLPTRLKVIMNWKNSRQPGFSDDVELIRAPLRIAINDLAYRRLPPSVISFMYLPDHRISFNVGGRIIGASTTTTWRWSGTRQQWFACPYCGRRCRELYLFFEQFACRLCHGFSYPRAPLKRWW